MHTDCAEVDELLLELADYKNDYADMAAEKLLRKCSTSWEALQLSAKLRSRFVATGQRTAAGATDYKKDTSPIASEPRIRMGV